MRPWHTLQTDHQSVRASRVVRFGDCLAADSGSRSESSRWNGVLNCAPNDLRYVPQFALYSHSARIWLLVQMRSPPNRSGGAGVRGERGESRLFLVESRRKVPEPRSLAHAAAPGESGAMCATSLILGAGANAAAYVLNTAPRVAHP